MDLKRTKLQIVVWLILAMIIIGTYTIFWINFKLIHIWLMEIALSLTIVFVLGKIFKAYNWKILIVTIGMDLIYHLYLAIRLYFLLNPTVPIEPIYHTTFLTTLQYTYGGDNGMVLVWIEIPFIILTILFVIGFHILKNSDFKENNVK